MVAVDVKRIDLSQGHVALFYLRLELLELAVALLAVLLDLVLRLLLGLLEATLLLCKAMGEIVTNKTITID